MTIEPSQRPAALAALYNSSRPQGLGSVHFDPAPMTIEQAVDVIERRGDRLYFDYLDGRVMKIDLSDDTLDFRLYDRDNGAGAGERAVRDALAG